MKYFLRFLNVKQTFCIAKINGRIFVMPASIIQFSKHCLSLPFGEFAEKTVIYDAAGIENPV